jgi:hypothetical protein
MGHDILAGQHLDADAITDKLSKLRWTPREWQHRLDEFPHIAHLRRSAYDVLGKVIYRALGAEHLYGGASGIGEVKSFTKLEISSAVALLPSVVADSPPPIDTEQVEEMATALGVESDPNLGPGIIEEQEFLGTILEWMTNSKAEHVEIYFG